MYCVVTINTHFKKINIVFCGMVWRRKPIKVYEKQTSNVVACLTFTETELWPITLPVSHTDCASVLSPHGCCEIFLLTPISVLK